MVEQLYHNPDIYRIYVPLPDNPLKYLNCYILVSDGETLIIDTGFNRPECKQALFDGLDELQVDFAHTKLFLTHLHGDHSGLTEELTARGVPVFMNAIDYDYLCQELASGGWQAMEQIFLSEGFPIEEIEKQKKGNQARLYSPHHPFPASKVSNSDLLTVGGITLRCIHTPGHTPGHTCLYIEEKEILFSGDHILFDITPNISVWRNIPYSLADYLESLQKIKGLKVSHTKETAENRYRALCHSSDLFFYSQRFSDDDFCEHVTHYA